MAFQAIGLTVTSRGKFVARLYRRRQEEPGHKAAPSSWITRHQALWSRVLAPVRPLDAPRGRATDRDSSWPLPRDLTSARRARRLVTAQLDDWGLRDLTDTAELLVSELVTNALCHTRGPLRLNLQARDSRLRCEVEDTDPTGPVRRVVDADAEGGRGIDLLDLLAEAWGSTRTATGKTMWFQLPAKASSPEASPAFD
ncbi:ATP-binding protein [Streptomyces sp. NBC_00365]|uniref:ATP-binding protein n=1 Tax=Streptomyces sp. NBC_00365 TaxID=2975726 RepID=UPI002256B3E1|nr:ATP-binding protein [Streptomyces sp. NBC_00365]MCX5091671.1 ATP-binding protein [Streptomyces sp. NBC_00365]